MGRRRGSSISRARASRPRSSRSRPREDADRPELVGAAGRCVGRVLLGRQPRVPRGDAATARRSGRALLRADGTMGSRTSGAARASPCLTETTLDSDTRRRSSDGFGSRDSASFHGDPGSDRTGTWSTAYVPGRPDVHRRVGPATARRFRRIDERTAMVGDGTAWSVLGRAGVHVWRDGGWAHHAAGGRFELDLRATGCAPWRRRAPHPREPDRASARRRSSSACRRRIPTRRSRFDFTNPLECLVATILSAQCTDETREHGHGDAVREVPDGRGLPARARRTSSRPTSNRRGSSTRRRVDPRARARASSRSTAGRCPTRWRT